MALFPLQILALPISATLAAASSVAGTPTAMAAPTATLTAHPRRIGNCTLTFSASIDDPYGQAYLDCPQPTTGIIYPGYKLVSILYSPPGNQSTQGYTNTTTNGTTTSIGNSFISGNSLTFSSGISGPLVAGGSVSYGQSKGNGSSDSFTQTWSNATGIASRDNSNSQWNPTASNAINHHLDTFEIWLNPQVTVLSGGINPPSYSIASQPTQGISALVADIIGVPAIEMEAQPGSISPYAPFGVSAVDVSFLQPQAVAKEDGSGNTYMPGLGAICQNNSLYLQHLAANLAGNDNPGICTNANQCGCTPADFSNILAEDKLLNYSAATYSGNPYEGIMSPLIVDNSGFYACSQTPIPDNADCRYVIVPITSGSSTPLIEPLSGSQSSYYQTSDATSTGVTTTQTKSYDVSISLTSGVFFANFKQSKTWTWTDTKSTGNTSGQSNTMGITLQTSTGGCNENVNIYEDTVFHTFVFQIPEGNMGC